MALKESFGPVRRVIVRGALEEDTSGDIRISKVILDKGYIVYRDEPEVEEFYRMCPCLDATLLIAKYDKTLNIRSYRYIDNNGRHAYYMAGSPIDWLYANMSKYLQTAGQPGNPVDDKLKEYKKLAAALFWRDTLLESSRKLKHIKRVFVA